MVAKSSKSKVYGGKGRNNKNGGFGGQINIGFSHIEQETWDRIFPPKDKNEPINEN